MGGGNEYHGVFKIDLLMMKRILIIFKSYMFP